MKYFNKTSLSSLALYLLSLSFAFGQTSLAGVIDQNVRLVAEKSPYIVEKSITIMENTTVFVEEGVTIAVAEGQKITVKGTLVIAGRSTNNVRIGSSLDRPTPGSWEGIEVSGNLNARFLTGGFAKNFLKIDGTSGKQILQGLTLVENDTAISYSNDLPANARDSLVLRRAVFSGNNVGLFSAGRVNMNSCVFEGNGIGMSGEGIFGYALSFIENIQGVNLTGSTLILCKFIRNRQYGFQGKSNIVLTSTFESNDVGVITGLGLLNTFIDNTVRLNRIGLQIQPGAVFDGLPIKGNSFCDNREANVQFLGDMKLDLSGNCWCETSLDSIVIGITDAEGNIALGNAQLDSFTDDCFDDLVYPGDANHNQNVTVRDIIPIGIFFGQTGPARPDASLLWEGQSAPDWGRSFRGGLDIKHVDCNGDGVINFEDISPIIRNYRRTHKSFRTTNDSIAGIPLIFGEIPNEINPGDVLRIPVYLGTQDSIIEDLYGLTFSMIYDTAQVEQRGVFVNFSESWIGTQNVDIIAYFQDVFTQGETESVVVRKDQIAVTGFGQVAEIIIAIAGDITKSETFSLDFGEISAVNKENEEIPVYGIGTTQTIVTNISGEFTKDIQFYPNPANDQIVVEWGTVPVARIQLIDIQGRTVLDKALEAFPRKQTITLEDIDPGVFLVQFHTSKGLWTQKLVIVP